MLTLPGRLKPRSFNEASQFTLKSMPEFAIVARLE